MSVFLNQDLNSPRQGDLVVLFIFVSSMPRTVFKSYSLND